MNNFLDISDLSTEDLREIIEKAKIRKSQRKGLNKSEPDQDKPFKGKSMVMILNQKKMKMTLKMRNGKNYTLFLYNNLKVK